MEFPFLSLQKLRTKPIEYEGRGVAIEIHSALPRGGIATIWDWDLLIYATAHLNNAIEQGLKTSPCLRFSPYDALRFMHKTTGGKDYRELVNAIRRLHYTHIQTTVRAGDAGGEMGFNWLSRYKIPKRYQAGLLKSLDDGDPDPVRPWEIELPSWLYNAILTRREILAVHPDYFDLKGGIERWLYRIARKAVPDHSDVKAINFQMETLHKQSGSSRPLRMFAHDIRKLAQTQPLPEYGVVVRKCGKHESVTLYRDRSKPGRPRRGIPPFAQAGKIEKPKGPDRAATLAWDKAIAALFGMPRKRLSNREATSLLGSLEIVRIEGHCAVLAARDDAGAEIRDALTVDLAEALRLSSGGQIDGVIIERDSD
jgi:plasmid replication initiation protein